MLVCSSVTYSFTCHGSYLSYKTYGYGNSQKQQNRSRNAEIRNIQKVTNTIYMLIAVVINVSIRHVILVYVLQLKHV
jgi:hypothetical protein